jgi:hypothetical protein
MLTMVVIPIIVADEDHLGMIDGFKLISLYHFSLDICIFRPMLTTCSEPC